MLVRVRRSTAIFQRGLARGLAFGIALVAAFESAAAEPPVDASIVPPAALSDISVEAPEGEERSARVVLELLITEQGTVGEVVVVEGEDPSAGRAVAAARRWRFSPARRGSAAIAARVRFLVEFHPAPAEQVVAPPAAPALGEAAPSSSSPAEPSASDAAALPEVEISVEGERALGATRLTRATARQLPGAFGNPLRAIETLPGVTPTVSGMPYFYVRGAPPGNVGYFLDGIRLPALFHVLAGPSVVHPAFLDEVEFHKGPYPARYGRYAGAIAAARMRPFEPELHGEANVRAFDSSAFVEAPLGERTSVSVGGRYSYADPIAQLFAPDISVLYWDYQTRIVTELGPDDQLQLFVFGSFDDLTNEGDDGSVRRIFGSEFHRFSLAHRHAWDDGWFRVMSLVGLDSSVQSEGDAELRDTLTRLDVEVSQELASTVRLLAGADIGHDRYRLTLGTIDDPAERADFDTRFPSRLESSTGVHAAITFEPTPGMHTTLGVRGDVYLGESDSVAAVSPRAVTELSVVSGVVLTTAIGLADQPPSNPFPQPGASPKIDDTLQRAIQSSAGVRVQLPEEVAFETSLFQSLLLDLTDGPGVSRIDNDESVDNEDESVPAAKRSLGSNHGLELTLRRAGDRKTTGYVSYTLSSSRRSLDRAEGPALFDRRHVLSGAVSQRFGNGFHAGLRGTVYTGLPADVAYLEAAKNPPRTPPFYRLDVRAEKRFSLGDERTYWAVVVEVLNATLQEEILGMRCNAYTCRQDPIGPVTVPSVGVEVFF
jgi:hypothetical protein